MTPQVPEQLTLAAVRFLNTRPLIYGLEQQPDLRLMLDVPAKLIDALETKQADVALLPVIDYQRYAGLRIVPSAGIGSFGETLTVRIFSHCPIGHVKTLACDPDSHTSVALARIILAELFAIHPEFVDLRRATDGPNGARLLIGDKVVCEAPQGFPHELDLGEAWKQLTGLPFVFAIWMAREGVDLRDLPQRLERAKRQGLEHVEELIERHAVPMGWPRELARKYLTQHLRFDIGPRELEAIACFHQLAAKHGLVANPINPLRLYGD